LLSADILALLLHDWIADRMLWNIEPSNELCAISGLSRVGRIDPTIIALSFRAAPLLSHSAESGALPTLFAATSQQAKGGGYYGPNGLSELKGSPAPARISLQAKDAAAAARLWDISGQLTHVSFDQHV
jgi:hypothetical protein